MPVPGDPHEDVARQFLAGYLDTIVEHDIDEIPAWHPSLRSASRLTLTEKRLSWRTRPRARPCSELPRNGYSPI
ncbi:MAG TPA: hypothetical protein VFD59_16360 [Nocardioidaceae bacterium]|nr:hypothetical protein [Nocardioidaceae bacterium]